MLPLPRPVPLLKVVVPVIFVIIVIVAAYSQVPQTAVPDNKDESSKIENPSQDAEKPIHAAAQVNPCTRVHVPIRAITLFTITDLSSKTATNGDEIELRVDNDIRMGDCLLIAKGASARAHHRRAETKEL